MNSLLQKYLVNTFFINLLETGLVFITISILYCLVILIISKSTESNRRRRQYKVRTFYIASSVFLFFTTKIWVEDFTHLLAIFGLVSAALVVTNKESIMNLVGGLIIMWRNLFYENDLIQIQQFTGYVKSIGVLYVSLSEVSAESPNVITGKIIRVPHGLFITNPMINYSQFSHLLEQKVSIKVARSLFDNAFVNHIENEVKQELSDFYKSKKEYAMRYLLEKHKKHARYISLTPKVYFNYGENKEEDIKLTIQYFCFATDIDRLKERIWATIFRVYTEHPHETAETCNIPS